MNTTQADIAADACPYVEYGKEFERIFASEFANDNEELAPNRIDISRHLSALFPPNFVHPYSESWIEIAYCKPDKKLDQAKTFSAFDIPKAVDFAEAKNKAGYNVYVGAALRHGEQSESGRSSEKHVLDASHAWAEFDDAGDAERIGAILQQRNRAPAIVVTTGTVPHIRAHLYFRLDGPVTSAALESANTALRDLLRSDNVQDAPRVMRLAGTINYPKKDKVESGYVPELTTLLVNKDERALKVDELIGLVPRRESDVYVEHGKAATSGRTDAELMQFLADSKIPKKWHANMLEATAIMIGRGYPDSAIKLVCAPYCSGSVNDPDLPKLIDDARKKWDKPNVEGSPTSVEDGDTAIDRLNKKHAVLPIGGKTRVVTFGELPDFPGRETITMVQSFPDFTALQDKYRHSFRNKKGEEESIPLGTHWIKSPKRRQFDGGMSFMPQQDDKFVGNRLNLWNGFGVKPVKPDGKSGAEGCDKFLEFMLNVICSGNKEHFEYLLKREATVFQKRIRSEVAIGLQTKEEGCGKGFYEKTMGRLLGNHAMQITNPRHIVGHFNPHLETLLRMTADEALFVGSHEHRNSLFNLITESKLTIEPKGYNAYNADNFLNISVLSNSEHFLPVSDTARRFFIPTVSSHRKQDHVYFGAIQHQLDKGGYEALLYHLLHEADLTGFNVRHVPQTKGLLQQRDQSLSPLDAWWCELLETGTLAGSDPAEPHMAVSNSYQREIEIGSPFNPQTRIVNQKGVYDQARQIEPRLRNHTSDHKLGHFLREMGCDGARVLRRRGWSFPPLLDCRAKWEERYPNWEWRDPDLTEWQPEEADDGGVALEVDEPTDAPSATRTHF